MALVSRESHTSAGGMIRYVFAAQLLALTLSGQIAVSGDIKGVHDPAIIAVGGRYLLLTTGEAHPGHIPIRCSNNLKEWTLCGRVFDELPAWAAAEIPGATTLWAPDISRYKDELRVYYAVSTFGHNDSAVGLVVNRNLGSKSPSKGWEDRGLVLRSHHGSDDWNAIDPNLATDSKGAQWLVFGSFWSGLKMRRIDAVSGLLDSRDSTLYSLAARPHQPGQPAAIEAPFIVKHGRFYYLFASFDFCCRGAKSNYYVAAGRASKITGPYKDRDRKAMLDGGGTTVVKGTERWHGPGHEAVLQSKQGDFLVFHAYDSVTGKPSLQISPLLWVHGWPEAKLF